MSNILLPWEQIEKWSFRTKYSTKNVYGWIIFDNDKWLYHAYDPENKPIFKSVGAVHSDYTSSKEEAQKIVDEALIKAGWKLIDKDDRILVLL